MRVWRSLAAVLAGLLLAGLGWSDSADISDLKVKNPADKVDIKSVPPPTDAVILFDGKSLDSWSTPGGNAAEWKVLDSGAMQVRPGKGNIVTRRKFDGSFKLHVEFRVPYQPKASGQGRGNSGVYLQGRYEVQVLDSYGLESKDNDCGGIYGVAAPLRNVCKAPTVWQSYDIEFTAPKCADGKVSEPARMTVHHNGVKIHDDVKLAKGGRPVTNTTAGLGGDPCKPGPIMLQDHGNLVEYRNIWLVSMK